MQCLREAFPLGPLSILCVLVLFTEPVSAQSVYGSLGNFDVFNDTGQDCHGFEVELDGLSSKDVLSEFASPNSQYPIPTLTDFAGGVYVDYESPYDRIGARWINTTVVPPRISPTLGHQCWFGANPNYETLGCEHFGLSLARNPTATHYRWLIANPQQSGSLKKFGSDVVMPAPTWTVSPPAAVGFPPVVRAIAPPPPENSELPEPQFGDAVWLNTFVTQKADHAVLNHMVQDGPDDPSAAETEVEMRISQAGPFALEKEVEENKDLVAGQNVVIRRYEVYKYLGAYDPESHEVLCDDPKVCPEAVGPYIGSQIAAANLVPGNLISAQVTTTGFVYSRVTKTFVGKVTVKNTGPQDAVAPLTLVFRRLPNGATLVNASGTLDGDPYLLFAPATTLPASASLSFFVQFTSLNAITFTPTLISGTIK